MPPPPTRSANSAKRIHIPRQRADAPGQFQLEQKVRELGDVLSRLFGQHVDMQGRLRAEAGDEAGRLGRIVERELGLRGLRRGIGLPPQRLNEVGRRRDQPRLVMTDQLVAPDGINIRRAAGEGEHLAIVGEGHSGRHERPSFAGRFDHQRSIRQSRDDAVALQEIGAVRIRLAREIGEQAALRKHLDRRLPMRGRVKPVEPMRKDADRG